MDFDSYLAPTPAINHNHPEVTGFIRSRTTPGMDHRAAATALFYAVRDQIRYTPYTIDLSLNGMQASTTLQQGQSWCIPKAVLLTACCRSLGIPARLGFADVLNHLSTPRLRERMQTDVFYWHGFTEIYLQGRWLKATPAFNRELCQKVGLPPLDFDGTADAIFQPFDQQGNEFMEYIRDRGTFADLPLDAIRTTFLEHYSRLFEHIPGDFEDEAAR